MILSKHVQAVFSQVSQQRCLRGWVHRSSAVQRRLTADHAQVQIKSVADRALLVLSDEMAGAGFEVLAMLKDAYRANQVDHTEDTWKDDDPERQADANSPVM